MFTPKNDTGYAQAIILKAHFKLMVEVYNHLLNSVM
jgi:hypothetical protein